VGRVAHNVAFNVAQQVGCCHIATRSIAPLTAIKKMHEQTWDPDRYSRNARFVSELGMPVVELLAPEPGLRILDLGCGDGALTIKLQELGCDIIGIDASAEQIEAARKLGLDARVMDARNIELDQTFDAVFTNAALHWVQDADAVIGGVRRVLKPGGRFVGEFGGAGNVAHVVDALSAAMTDRGLDAGKVFPWYFPSPEEYSQKLQSHGFDVRSIELIPRPTPLPNDIISWIETFGECFIMEVPAAERTNFLHEVRERLRPTLLGEDGVWKVDYVRLRFDAEVGASSQ
jgi:trans-aconitate methyltransferase